MAEFSYVLEGTVLLLPERRESLTLGLEVKRPLGRVRWQVQLGKVLRVELELGEELVVYSPVG